jgi:hypothetical protein
MGVTYGYGSKQEVNYHPQCGWLDFEPLKGGEKT